MCKKFLFISVLLMITIIKVAGQISDEVKLANEYYSAGETAKALILYEQLANDYTKISLIHNNYFYLLLSGGSFKSAHRYINKITKRFPGNINYQLDRGKIFIAEGKNGSAENYYSELIKQISTNSYLVSHVSNYFVSNQMYERAEVLLLESRKTLDNPYLYSLELANLYRIANETDKMMNEYVNYVVSNPANSRYIKSLLQSILETTEELERFESILYLRLKEKPDNLIYPEMLIWVNLQLKNFYAAFIQARSIDKRNNLNGSRSYEVGRIALDNGDFESASKIFNWLISNYKDQAISIRSRMSLIEAWEMKVKNTFPVSENEIRKLVSDYDSLIQDYGMDSNTLEAIRNKALLHAFYLDERDLAVQLLNSLIQYPRTPRTLKSKSKLDLGDIYLLSNESWESTLLYSQVEKEMKLTPLAYEAKLRNARLSYFKGDFLLAQEHLDILKKATTRDIANDAMALSILIKENITLDSSEVAMREYSRIELLLYQNKQEKALELIDSVKKVLPHHSLNDDLLWLEANLHLKAGNFEVSLRLFDKIFQQYGLDIHGDDSYFMMGEIYERHLSDKQKATEIYLDFLSRYPGSVYSVEARKRFRILRGDFEEVIN